MVQVLGLILILMANLILYGLSQKCISVNSSISANGQNTVSCDGQGDYTHLLSCGYITEQADEKIVPGVIFNSSSQSCTTAWRNHQAPPNQTLIARCCSIEEFDDLQCNEPTNFASSMVLNGKIKEAIECADTEILFGCTNANFNTTSPRGAYPFGTDEDFLDFGLINFPKIANSSADLPTCAAEAVSSVTPQGMCCDNKKKTAFQCETVIGKGPTTSSVNCAALNLTDDYFMVSCSGYSDDVTTVKYVYFLYTFLRLSGRITILFLVQHTSMRMVIV